MRQALLRRLLAGDNKTQAAAALQISIRAIQRYARKHKEFELKIEDAIRLGRRGLGHGGEARALVESEGLLVDLREELTIGATDELKRPEQIEPATPEEDLPEQPAVDLPVVAKVTEAEVVDLVPTASADPRRSGPDPFEGLAPFGERELLALSWRLVLDPKTSAGVHSTHARCLYGHFKARARRSLLQQLGSRSSSAPPPGRPVERGLTKLAVARFRRELIGPPPAEDEDDESVA